MKCDIVIIGGGIIGSSIAYFLTRTGQAGDVLVVEPDPTYSWAATPRGAGGVRQLFSLPENIWMSRYSLAFFADFSSTMAVEGHPAEIHFKHQGYLFVASEKGAKRLEANFHLQIQEGVQAELFNRRTLEARFPSISTRDFALACFSPDDGWLDSEAVLWGFRRKAEDLGVSYIEDRVIGLEIYKHRVEAAKLEQGGNVQGDVFINAAGAWAGEIADMVGMRLPIEVLPRLQHYWKCQEDIESLPLVKDESGLFFRPEGPGFTGGCPSWDFRPGFSFEGEDGSLDRHFREYFDRVVWPLLILRVPKFDALRCERTWVGHYAQNVLDGNMILGPWGGEVDNFYIASGFSGHGLMHAPAVGLALSELILKGRYSTMDLSRMSYQRVLEGEPYREKGII